MSDTITQASSKKLKRLRSKCCCDWSECRAWQEAFTFKAENDIRGGDVKTLDLTGDDEESTKLRNSVLDNIFKDRKNASGIKDLRRVYVAKHHWTVEQLEFLERTGKRPTTPVDIATLGAMVRVVETALDDVDYGDRKMPAIEEGESFVIAVFHTTSSL